MTVDETRAKSIFLAASELPNLAERVDYLVQQCGSDGPLRDRVEALLRAHEAATDIDILPSGFVLEATFDTPEVARPGTLIAGRYKLRQQIGEGGMGTVWMADQSEPVKRRVAVKLVRVDRGQSKTILARFEAERQAIALMDHPHIAKLLDAGTTDTGAPFFVMELVQGIPLIDFCDQHQLTIPERLNLFTQICSAVQHAHQKGIIHRDLKPSNILVESHDGKPVPKVIDFGLAKATSSLQLTEKSMFTAFGSVMGTPLYMAPEQANFNAVDIDTRADVYALGVILYELLTGTTPITRETMKKAALDEMLKLIREQEAPTPSSRLSSVDSAPSVAASRQIEPVKLGRFVRGELDWIVLKALSKDRDRRYETANGFARDIERFLNHEPVTAGPPSARYRLQKFVQRNRGQVIAASLVLLALVTGVVGTTLGLVEARRQAVVADGERSKALLAAAAETAAKEEAEAKRRDAETNLEYARKGNDVLSEVFSSLDPRANHQTVAELRTALRAGLVRAVAALDSAAIGDPLTVADLQDRLGQSLLALGESAEAVTLFERSRNTRLERLGADDPLTLRSENNLAYALLTRSGAKEALPLFEDVLARRESRLGPDHLDTLNTANNLGQAYRGAGRFDRAIELFERAYAGRRVALGDNHPDTLTSLNNLAVARSDAGQIAQSVDIRRQSYTGRRETLGPDHPDTLNSLNNLATGLQAVGKLDEAVPLFEQALAAQRARLGSDHQETLSAMTNLGYAYHLQKRHDLALPLLEQALRGREARLGANHRDTLSGVNNLALAYKANGQTDKALSLFERASEQMAATLGFDHPDTLAAQVNLATTYRENGRIEESISMLELVLEREEAKLGKDHPSVLTTTGSLANAYKANGQHDKAISIYQDVLARRKALYGESHPDTVASVGNLGSGYVAAGRNAEAVATLEQFVAARRKQLPIDQFATLLTLVGPNMLTCGRADLAEAYIREALDIRQKADPDAWGTANLRSMLGGVLLRQERYADAEPLLINGYEGMTAHQMAIPPQRIIQLPEALQRLVQLYTDWHAAEPDQGHDAKAADWQTKLDEFKAALASEKSATTADK